MENKIWVECVSNVCKNNEIYNLEIGKKYQAQDGEDYYFVLFDPIQSKGLRSALLPKPLFKLIPPPVTEEKWVVANKSIDTLCITENEKYLVVSEDEFFYKIINDSKYESTCLRIHFYPPTKGESESESISESKILEDLLSHCDTLIESNKGLASWSESFISGIYAVRGKISYWKSKIEK